MREVVRGDSRSMWQSGGLVEEGGELEIELGVGRRGGKMQAKISRRSTGEEVESE